MCNLYLSCTWFPRSDVFGGRPCTGDHAARPMCRRHVAHLSCTCSWQLSYSCILWGVRWAHLWGLPVQDLITFVYLSCKQLENLNKVSLVNSLTVLSVLLERWEGWENLRSCSAWRRLIAISLEPLMFKKWCSPLMCAPIMNGSLWLCMSCSTCRPSHCACVKGMPRFARARWASLHLLIIVPIKFHLSYQALRER